MNKAVATGLIASGAIGAVGLAWAVSDRNTRRRMMKDGAKIMKKAGRIMDWD